MVGQRERRRTGRKELSRQDILDAAEHVFGQKGYHEASLQEIAERAEFSTSALYRFFDNKEALFIGVLARRGDDFMLGMRELFALPSPAEAPSICRFRNLLLPPASQLWAPVSAEFLNCCSKS